MGGDRVGELARVLDLVERNQNLRRNLLVQFDVLLELADHRTRQRLEFLGRADLFVENFGIGLEELFVLGELLDPRAAAAFDEDLHGAVGQLEQLQNGADGTDHVDIIGAGIVLSGILLGDEQDLLVVFHDVFQGAHGLLAPDEQRHDHVGKHHDVAQR